MTLRHYIIGFVLSLVLTLAAYIVVVNGLATGLTLALLLAVLALVQMVVQLVYFLHLGDDLRPRYRLLSFVFMFGVLLILVAGSIWIIYNMNYNMMHMTPQQKDTYMRSQYDKGF